MFGIGLIALCFIAYVVGEWLAFDFVWNRKRLERRTEDLIEEVIGSFGLLMPLVVLMMMVESTFTLNFGLWVTGLWFPAYFFVLPIWLEYKVAVGRY